MSKARTLLLPSQTDGWEVWACTPSGCSLKKTITSPGQAKVAGPGTVVGVPAKHCRTLALNLPSGDSAVLRKMAYSQIERRGLARGSLEETLFDCHSQQSDHDGETSVSVDVLSDLPDGLELKNARGYTAAARLFPLPANKLVLWREQDQLVLSVGRNGKLVYNQVIGPIDRLKNGAAHEIQMTQMALESEGLISDGNRGLEVWMDDPDIDLSVLRSGVGMPVEVKPRPEPSAALATSETTGEMVPSSVLVTRKRHRRTWMLLCLAAALAMAYVVVLHRMRSDVSALEAQIPNLEKQVEQTKGVAEKVKQIQARWNTLRPVLEPKRYPLVHLSHIARVMPGGGVLITDYESKIQEVRIRGIARDTAAAYEMLRLMVGDEELKVYNWEMPQPTVMRDSRASFEIKGKLR